MIRATDGCFYGITYNGGTNGVGTVFRLAIVPDIEAATLANNVLNLTWSTEAGGTYQLQFNSALNSNNWNKLGTNVTATRATLTTTDSPTIVPQRFYRLVLIP